MNFIEKVHKNKRVKCIGTWMCMFMTILYKNNIFLYVWTLLNLYSCLNFVRQKLKYT